MARARNTFFTRKLFKASEDDFRNDGKSTQYRF